MNRFWTSVIIITAMAIVTAITRFTPFLLFDRGKEPPKWVVYLGKVLPSAMMSVLLIYCLRNVSVLSGSHGIPELICVLIAMGLHAWKGNVLLSIGASTALYMILVQTVFA